MTYKQQQKKRKENSRGSNKIEVQLTCVLQTRYQAPPSLWLYHTWLSFLRSPHSPEWQPEIHIPAGRREAERGDITSFKKCIYLHPFGQKFAPWSHLTSGETETLHLYLGQSSTRFNNKQQQQQQQIQDTQLNCNFGKIIIFQHVPFNSCDTLSIRKISLFSQNSNLTKSPAFSLVTLAQLQPQGPLTEVVRKEPILGAASSLCHEGT